MKKCTKCGVEKELDAFTPDNRRKDGRISICKECNRICKKTYYKKYHLKNRDKKIEATKEWCKNNVSRRLSWRKEYQERPEVKERHNRRQRQYYHQKKERKEYLEKWIDANKERVNKYKKDSFRKNIHKTIKRKQEERNSLKAPYIKERLRCQYGIYDSHIRLHPELIEMKRLELRLNRYVKQNKK